MFACTYEGCSFSTIFKDRFRDHINKHEGIKNHVCSICGKAFAARKHMQRHEKSHVEIKPFGCNECEYRSTRRDKLNEHIRKHHPWNAVALGLMNAELLENPQALALPKVRKPKKKKTKLPVVTKQETNESVDQEIDIMYSNSQGGSSHLLQPVPPHGTPTHHGQQQQGVPGQQDPHGQPGPHDPHGQEPHQPQNMLPSHMLPGPNPHMMAPQSMTAALADAQPAYLENNLALYALSNYTWSTIQSS